MDPAVYDTYYRMEREHWWFLVRRELVLETIRRYYRGDLKQAHIVDIGAGTGSYLEAFAAEGLSAEGHDSSPEAVDYLKKVSSFKVHRRSFPEDYGAADANRCEVVLLLDVLEHVKDDASALDRAVSLLKPGGLLVITVPACKAMWSPYDIYNRHFRRYSMPEIRALLDARADIRVLKRTFFSTLLFPLLFSARAAENAVYKVTGRMNFNPHFVPGPANRLLMNVFRLEKGLLRKGDLPYGSSILAVVEKK